MLYVNIDIQRPLELDAPESSRLQCGIASALPSKLVQVVASRTLLPRYVDTPRCEVTRFEPEIEQIPPRARTVCPHSFTTVQ